MLPARYQSSRFPGKPLVPILGKPMILRTYEQARAGLPLAAEHPPLSAAARRRRCRSSHPCPLPAHPAGTHAGVQGQDAGRGGHRH